MAQEKIFRLQSDQQDKYTSHTEMTKRQVVAHALSDAIKAIELPLEINIRAYQVKLERLIKTDDYANPKRGFNHTTHINGIINREEMWSEFENLFHLLDHGELDFIAMQTIKIFYRLNDETTDQKQYDKVRLNVAKLLDCYDLLEILDELKKRNL